MRITLYWLCFLLFSSIAALSQPRVSNVRFDLHNKSKVIEIKYDIADVRDADSVYVVVNAVRRGVIVPRNISGDIGKNIRPGKNKKVIWDVLADSLKINDDMVIRVNVLPGALPLIAATDSVKRKPPVIKKDKGGGVNGLALATLGGGLVVGGGMYYLSTVQKKLSADSYEFYKENNWNHKSDIALAGDDPYLRELSKASLEQAKADLRKAKRQQTLSKALLFGGIAIVIADAIFTIPMLAKRKNSRVGLYLDLDARGVASAGFQIKLQKNKIP
ncbi:hypothetical protein LZD49_31655 [Dyadobacter sp. CY261]|uniref:hypothetical protein n=1 Tax=Dyadobacter sp. CY261 TaxID=2907203 RepID=UPI001F16603B|nr:hypothetical protein [Dyadobacter sp. CY261]MCF0075083.1 hypothetical protein [Dyadobacter sp. CY261]